MNPNSIRTLVAAAGTAALAALLAACGGGAEGTGDVPVQPAANITSLGAMTVGSVIVNGIEFDDSRATIIDDRNRARTRQANGIAAGMTVVVRGRTDDNVTGRADVVKVRNEVRGRIATANLAANPPSFTIGGLTVYIDSGVTVLQPPSAALAAGTRVEVHGQRDINGNLRATRVEVVGDGDGLDELRGTIASVAGNTVTLVANTPNAAVSIDIAGAALQPAGTTASDLRAGAVIEVRGTMSGNTFAATTVVLDDRDDDSRQLSGNANEKAEVEGFVSGFMATSASFKVGARTVLVTAGTRYERGIVGDLVDDVLVEAEGTLDAGGILTASKIEFRKPRTILTGTAQNRDPIAQSFTVFGITVALDSLTQGILPADGTRVEVRGHAGASGGVIAERIVDRSTGGNTDNILQGVVSAKGDVNNRTLTILGLSCDLTNASLQNGPADPVAWFAAITLNRSVVKLKGSIAASSCSVTEAEIEN